MACALPEGTWSNWRRGKDGVLSRGLSRLRLLNTGSSTSAFSPSLSHSRSHTAIYLILAVKPPNTLFTTHTRRHSLLTNSPTHDNTLSQLERIIASRQQHDRAHRLLHRRIPAAASPTRDTPTPTPARTGSLQPQHTHTHSHVRSTVRTNGKQAYPQDRKLRHGLLLRLQPGRHPALTHQPDISPTRCHPTDRQPGLELSLTL
jgi:hypothetical protein